jgi:hypothetical protein
MHELPKASRFAPSLKLLEDTGGVNEIVAEIVAEVAKTGAGSPDSGV